MLTAHVMVSWVELFATKLVMVGAAGPVVVEGLNQCNINNRGSLKDMVVEVMLVGLLTRPTALVSLTWMV